MFSEFFGYFCGLLKDSFGIFDQTYTASGVKNLEGNSRWSNELLFRKSYEATEKIHETTRPQ